MSMSYAGLYLICASCTAFGYCMNAVMRGAKSEIAELRHSLKRHGD
jgi:hypothetical protein